MPTEADTCRRYVVPALQRAGWDAEPHAIAEQRTITVGRIIPVGRGFVRKPPKRADFLLFYERGLPLGVVESKAEWRTAGDGLQQAKEYAEMLGLPFAYATNGPEILEFDYLTGRESILTAYPTPDELWHRYRAARGLDDRTAEQLLSPINTVVKRGERYYAQIAINRSVEDIRYSDYVGEKVRTLFPDVKALSKQWADPEARSSIIDALAERGISFDELAEDTGQAQGERTGVEGPGQGPAGKRLQPRPQEPQRQGRHHPPAARGTRRIDP